MKTFVFTARACAAPLIEAAELFRRQTGIEVEIGQCSRHCASANAEEATGGTGGDDFLQEIADAGIYDCAIAGAEYLLDDGEVRGIIARGKRRTIALRRSAIIVAAGNPLGISRLQDLARPGLRLAVSVLDCLKGLWEDICGRAGLIEPVRANVSFYANGCIALVESIVQGKADAALGWSAFEHLASGRISVVPLSDSQSISRSTAIGLLKTARNVACAERFMDYLASEPARAIYRRYGWV
jgi:molybdate transport system substrate-binding protein